MFVSTLPRNVVRQNCDKNSAVSHARTFEVDSFKSRRDAFVANGNTPYLMEICWQDA